MSYGKYVALVRDGLMPTVPRSEMQCEQDDTTKECAYCGGKFSVLSRGRYAKYCSGDCYRKMNNRRAREKYEKIGRPKKKTEDAKPKSVKDFVFQERTQNCQFCGAEFDMEDFRGNRKYCSERCRRDSANRAARMRYTPGKATRKKKPKTARCGVCGKEFTVSAHSRKYCSGECARSAILAHARARDAQRREKARKEIEEC